VWTSPGPSCLIRPSFSRSGGTEAHARAQQALIPSDSMGQEACYICNEWLQLQRLKRQVENDLELMCSWTAYVGKTSLMASSLANRGILHLLGLVFFPRQNRGWNLVCSLLISFEFPNLCSSLFLVGLISGRHGCFGAADGVVPGAGGEKCCCAGACSGGCRGSHL
jgi:hypothetical protein